MRKLIGRARGVSAGLSGAEMKRGGRTGVGGLGHVQVERERAVVVPRVDVGKFELNHVAWRGKTASLGSAPGPAQQRALSKRKGERTPSSADLEPELLLEEDEFWSVLTCLSLVRFPLLELDCAVRRQSTTMGGRREAGAGGRGYARALLAVSFASTSRMSARMASTSPLSLRAR